jgi:RNA ligase
MMTLEQALQMLEGREEFVVKRYDGLVCINYVLQFPDSFDGLRENFRGITFDEQLGMPISVPFHKFFNIGQKEYTLFSKIRHRTANVFEKMDGTMIHFFKHHGEIFGASRMGVTDFGKWGLDLARKLMMLTDISQEIDEGYTPIFELVAPNNIIVVRYNEPRLVYLNSRNIYTGEYRLSTRFRDRARKFDIPFKDIEDDLLDKCDMEGYVSHLLPENGEPGIWVKAKCSWYMERHRAYDLICKPKYRLFELVYEGVMDDVIATTVDDLRKQQLTEIYEEGQRDLLHEFNRIKSLYTNVLRSSRSTTVQQWVEKTVFKSFPEENRKKVMGKLRQHIKLSWADIAKIMEGLPYYVTVPLDKRFAEDLRDLGCDVEVQRVPEEMTGKDEDKRLAIFLQNFYMDDFHPLMKLHNGQDAMPILQDRLLRQYKDKYPNPIFAGASGAES